MIVEVGFVSKGVAEQYSCHLNNLTFRLKSKTSSDVRRNVASKNHQNQRFGYSDATSRFAKLFKLCEASA